jgi:hypothetical protein
MLIDLDAKTFRIPTIPSNILPVTDFHLLVQNASVYIEHMAKLKVTSIRDIHSSSTTPMTEWSRTSNRTAGDNIRFLSK